MLQSGCAGTIERRKKIIDTKQVHAYNSSKIQHRVLRQPVLGITIRRGMSSIFNANCASTKLYIPTVFYDNNK